MKKLSTRKLHNRIRKIQKELRNNISLINSGGCGIFAYYLGVRLEELGIKYEIVVNDTYRSLEEWKDEVEEFRLVVFNSDIPYFPNTKLINPKKTNQNNYKGLTCHHIMIKIEDHYLDAEIIRKSWYADEGKRYKLDELKLAVATPINWNPAFDREQMPLVYKIINKHL